MRKTIWDWYAPFYRQSMGLLRYEITKHQRHSSSSNKHGRQYNARADC